MFCNLLLLSRSSLCSLSGKPTTGTTSLDVTRMRIVQASLVSSGTVGSFCGQTIRFLNAVMLRRCSAHCQCYFMVMKGGVLRDKR